LCLENDSNVWRELPLIYQCIHIVNNLCSASCCAGLFVLISFEVVDYE
jgi:hypothetical protein